MEFLNYLHKLGKHDLEYIVHKVGSKHINSSRTEIFKYPLTNKQSATFLFIFYTQIEQWLDKTNFQGCQVSNIHIWIYIYIEIYICMYVTRSRRAHLLKLTCSIWVRSLEKVFNLIRMLVGLQLLPALIAKGPNANYSQLGEQEECGSCDESWRWRRKKKRNEKWDSYSLRNYD